jgi:hypothetical protein
MRDFPVVVGIFCFRKRGIHMSNLYGVTAYQAANQLWSQSAKKKDEVSKKQAADDTSGEVTSQSGEKIKTSTWSPIDTTSSLVPSNKDGIGLAIGDVELSDEAKEYYNKLKAKYSNMQFIAVSQDMKSQVQANAAAYGNANKMVVLIDDAKLEQMATDESFRKMYEGIIEMSQVQLESAKNSLTSSGASVKNFGMSVNSDGSSSFFATVEKSSDAQTERLEKKQAEKKEAKAKEKKKAQKQEKQEKIEKAREERKEKQEEIKEDIADRAEEKDDITGRTEQEDTTDSAEEKEYIEIKSFSLDDLINKVSRYAYENSSQSVMTEEEKSVGQNFDIRG